MREGTILIPFILSFLLIPLSYIFIVNHTFYNSLPSSDILLYKNGSKSVKPILLIGKMRGTMKMNKKTKKVF